MNVRILDKSYYQCKYYKYSFKYRYHLEVDGKGYFWYGGELTTFFDGTHLDVAISFDENNPEASINRFRKLLVLK